MLVHCKRSFSVNGNHSKLSYNRLWIIGQMAVTINVAQGSSPNGLPRPGQTQAIMTIPQKWYADDVSTPSPKCQKIVNMMELDKNDTKVVTVQLYKDCLDWYRIREAQVRCDKSGGINLEDVREALGVQGQCRVSQVIG